MDAAAAGHVAIIARINRAWPLSFSGPGITATFSYDALGRRAARTVNGQVIGYVYDGVQAIAEVTGGAISATLLTGLNIDEVLARYTQAGNRAYLTDALGSVIAQANDSQAIENYYDYSPYGETQSSAPDGGNTIQYTARENDGTGLYYYRARYYDPVLKRFIAEDPIGLEGGANLYAYVHGNPISYTDPSGELVPLILIPIISGTIGGIAGGVGNYLVQKYWQGKCDIDWIDVLNAAAWGALGGAALPASGTTLAGAAAVGATANLGQYFTGQIINGASPTLGGSAWNGLTGAVGGGIGGSFTRPVGYGAIGTALPQQAINAQTMQTISANSGVGNLAISGIGGVTGNLPPSLPSTNQCGCNR